MSCDDGQEDSLKKLTNFLDKNYSDLKSKLGIIGENKLLLITAIKLIDEHFDLRRRITEQKNKLDDLSNKVEYKYHLIGYYSTLDHCLEYLIEHCLTNNEEINSIKEIKQQISELHEKISEISAENDRAIEQNILSNKLEEEQDRHKSAEELADQYLK